jgi:hypothetical protein
MIMNIIQKDLWNLNKFYNSFETSVCSRIFSNAIIFGINKFVNYFTVQGYWTSWSDWGACNASCGGGIRVKQRTCFNQDVGDDALLVCIGDGTENDTCNTNECPSKNIHTNDNDNS